MESDENDLIYWRINNPILWGIGFTLILILTIIVLAIHVDCVEEICSSKFTQFLNSGPNEIGDTLAGLAGGLAFLWIIVTVMLQSQELTEQRKELRRSRKEYEKMAMAMTMQSSIFEKEQEQRTEKGQDEVYNSMMRLFLYQISPIHVSHLRRTYSYEYNQKTTVDYNAQECFRILSITKKEGARLVEPMNLSDETLGLIESAVQIYNKLSEPQKIRFDLLQTKSLNSFVLSLKDNKVKAKP